MSYYDPFRFLVEDVHGNILARDVEVMEPSVARILSGPSQIEFKIHPQEPSIQVNGGPIQFKPWGAIVHAIKEDWNGDDRIWASGIVKPGEIDPTTGVLTVKAEGYSSYPKGIPWLENWNPIAVDPFEVVERIWNHIQNYTNGNLGVTVYPTTSGTQILPGFGFNNEIAVQEFFAVFIRAADRNDCGEYIERLARDIPFDYIEESTWNETKTGIIKKIKLGYPNAGTAQDSLVFRLGDNVLQATPKQQSEVEWFSDITINGYFPGKVYSATISNADPDRFRRVMDETDLNVDSNERAAAWAKKLLTRRQFPNQFESLIIDPYHPNAPFLSYDIGDTVKVDGEMPWVGHISEDHKITMIIWQGDQVELKVMAEGAFNYDPIEYVDE